MTNNDWPALVPDKDKPEPEYKEKPPLLVSSVGTDNAKRSSSRMPFGSAILTNTGYASKLKDNGINHIIHAALMPQSQASDENAFIQKAVLAMQNSIILADRQGFKKLATCFLAGGIYCNNESTKPLLAEALIIGALNQLEKCEKLREVFFIDFDGDYLKDAGGKMHDSGDYPEINNNKIKIWRGDKNQNLLHKSFHGAEVIVNSENAEMEFRGGISGKIKEELGSSAKDVDRQRKDLMRKFNSLIEGETRTKGENNNKALGAVLVVLVLIFGFSSIWLARKNRKKTTK